MTMYRRGLKFNVKEELMRTGARIDDLDTLMAEAIDVDDKLYELAMEKRHDGGTSGMGRSGIFAGDGYNKKRFQPRDPYGHTPMELDFTQKQDKGKFRGKKQQKRGKKAVTCYGCGKPGHFARDCRTKNMVLRPQLNILRRVPCEEPSNDPENRDSDLPPEWVEVGKPEVVAKEGHYFEFVRKVPQFIRNLSKGKMTPQDINERIKQYLVREGRGDLELEEFLQCAINDIQDDVERLRQQLQDIQDRKMELESSDDGEVLEYSSEHGQEIQESSEEEAPRYGLSAGIPNNSQSCATASQGSNREKNSEKTRNDKLYVKDYRFDSTHPQHGVMHWTACADDYCKYHWAAREAIGRWAVRATCGQSNWENCTEDSCNWHLVSKRRNLRFPGSSEGWHNSVRGQLEQHPNTRECHLIEWYACRHDRCRKHMHQKTQSGFLPEQGKE